MAPITRDDLHRIFKNLDRDGDGSVSIDELHCLLDRIGVCVTLEELEKLMGGTCLDCINFLCFYEAMVKAGVVERDGDWGDGDLVEAFKVFDLNGDGFISSEELERTLLRMGLLEKQNRQDCKEMIGVYDRNSDGVLDFDEFKNMMSVPPEAGSKIVH